MPGAEMMDILIVILALVVAFFLARLLGKALVKLTGYLDDSQPPYPPIK